MKNIVLTDKQIEVILSAIEFSIDNGLADEYEPEMLEFLISEESPLL